MALKCCTLEHFPLSSYNILSLVSVNISQANQEILMMSLEITQYNLTLNIQ